MAKKKVWTEADLVREEAYWEKVSETMTWRNSGPEFEAWKKMMMEAAANTIKEKNIDVATFTSTPISIKIPQAELESFRKLAESEGLKYQTKLNQLIYQYNRGQLKVVIE